MVFTIWFLSDWSVIALVSTAYTLITNVVTVVEVLSVRTRTPIYILINSWLCFRVLGRAKNGRCVVFTRSCSLKKLTPFCFNDTYCGAYPYSLADWFFIWLTLYSSRLRALCSSVALLHPRCSLLSLDISYGASVCLSWKLGYTKHYSCMWGTRRLIFIWLTHSVDTDVAARTTGQDVALPTILSDV